MPPAPSRPSEPPAAGPPRATPASAPAPRWARAASFAVPFALAVGLAGNGMGFYDSPELAAAGAGLGVTHPPGHPLQVVLWALASLVPVGAVAFRLELAQAVCLALAGRLAFAAAFALAQRMLRASPAPAWTATVAALAASLCATLGPAALRQTTRTEVYALAALLATAPLALGAREDRPLAPRARLAVLALALGATDHHFIALTASPLVAWLLLERLRAAPGAKLRSLAAWAPLFVLGLVPYVLLPLRARAPASLPRVDSLGDFLDTASARTFARSLSLHAPGGLPGGALGVLDWLGATLTPVGLLFAAGGLYLAVRARSTGAARDAGRIALVALAVCAARAWLGFVQDNPDAAGYLLPAAIALGVAIAGFVAGSAHALAGAPAPPRGPSRPARALLWAVLLGLPCVLPAYLALASTRASSEDRSYAPEALATAALASLPPRAVLFAYDPQSIFRLRYAALIEGERPDATVVPVPLLGYPGMVQSLLGRDAALVPVMTRYILRPDQGMSARLLSDLASRRSVAIELDPRNVREFTPALLPRVMVFQVMPEPTTLAAVRGASAAHFTRVDQLATLLQHGDGAPVATARVDEVLLWHAYTDALFFAARGARAEARRAVARGLAIDPEARELVGLRQALGTPGEGPVDVGPFTTGE